MMVCSNDVITIGRSVPYLQYRNQINEFVKVLGVDGSIINQGTYLHMDEYMTSNEKSLMDLLYENSKYCNSFSMEILNEELKSSNQDRITQLKSQLKHCKNHMQRLNIERELNKLYKNKER